MRRIFFTTIALAAMLATPALADSPPPAITVSGEATVSVAPDEARIDAGVSSEAKTAREASEANNAAMGKVLLALKGASIDEKDYQTSRLSLQPQYAQPAPNRNTPQISGYRASNRVSIRLRDVTKVSSVIDTLVSAGANEIGGIQFVVSQASKVLDEARVPEWKDTVNVPSETSLRLAVRFDERPGMWMLHCHILDHAEAGMMGHLQVLPADGEGEHGAGHGQQ